MTRRGRVALKVAVWAGCLGPLALLLVRAARGDLTANPISFVTNTLGDWTFRLLLTSLALNGCLTYHRGDFAAISTKAVPSKMEIVDAHAEGKSCKTNRNPRFQLAVDDALEKVPRANALVNVSYRLERFCIVVSGTAVRIIE